MALLNDTMVFPRTHDYFTPFPLPLGLCKTVLAESHESDFTEKIEATRRKIYHLPTPQVQPASASGSLPSLPCSHLRPVLPPVLPGEASPSSHAPVQDSLPSCVPVCGQPFLPCLCVRPALPPVLPCEVGSSSRALSSTCLTSSTPWPL